MNTLTLIALATGTYALAIYVLSGLAGFSDAPPTTAERAERRRRTRPLRIALARVRFVIAQRDYQWAAATNPPHCDLVRHKEAAALAAAARLDTLLDQRTADDIAHQASRAAKRALLDTTEA